MVVLENDSNKFLVLSRMKLFKTNVLTAVLIIASVVHINVRSQGGNVDIDSVKYAIKIDSLRSRFSPNKTIDSSIELAALIALEHLDCLEETRIIVKNASIGTSLNARPTVGSLLFRKKSKRKYVIRVNNKENGKIPLLSDANFNATVGVLGHELCHIKDYSSRNFGGVLQRLFAYGSKKGKSKYEKEIDSMTIWSGLGWQLAEWEEYVQNSPNATDKYKAFKREIYYEAEEIKELTFQYEKTL